MCTVQSSTLTLPEQTLMKRAVEAVSGALRRCDVRATKPQHDSYIKNIKQKVTAKRLLLAGHEIALAFNAFLRESPQDDVEAPFHAALAHVRSWYAQRDGRVIARDLEQLCKAETAAQGYADLAQWDLRNPSAKTLADADNALSVHVVTLLQLRDEVRRQRYTTEQVA